ncbi:MAG: peptidoglycan-binding protein [Planctomycetota bacterium]
MSRHWRAQHLGAAVIGAGSLLLGLSPAWGWSNGNAPGSALTPIYVPGGSGQLRNDAAASWNTMRLYFKRTGRGELYPGGSLSSYRTFAMQVRAKQLYGSNAATPGTSNHGWGLAVDLATRGMRAQIDRRGAHFGWAKKWSDASWEWWHLKYRSGVWKQRPNPGTSAAYPIIRKGSGGRGQDGYVKALRKNLRKHGYNVKTKGDFGKGLNRVVKDFQRDHHLKPDGIVGKKTWKKLKAKPKKPKPPKPTPTKPTNVADPGKVSPITLAPNGTKTVTIAFRNIGSAIWTPSQTFLKEVGSGPNGFKVAIDATTKPTEVGKFVFNVHVPKNANTGSILEKLAVYDKGKKVSASDVGLKVTVK